VGGDLGQTPDLMPLVGPVPGRDRVWVAGGYSGHGNVPGFMCGDLVARAILGDRPAELELFDPVALRLARAERAVARGLRGQCLAGVQDVLPDALEARIAAIHGATMRNGRTFMPRVCRTWQRSRRQTAKPLQSPYTLGATGGGSTRRRRRGPSTCLTRAD